MPEPDAAPPAPDAPAPAPTTSAELAESRGGHAAERAGLAAGLLALLLLAALGVWAWRSTGELAAAGAALLRSQQALTALAGLQTVLADATAADASRPAAAAALRRAADAQLGELRSTLADAPEPYQAVVSLGVLLARRFDALEAAADSRPHKATAAPPAEGPPVGERARAAVAALQQQVLATLPAAQGRADAAAGHARWRVGAAAAAAVALLALAAGALLQVRTRLRRAQRSAQAAQRAREDAERTLQRVFDASLDGLAVIDAHGRWVRVGRTAARLWGTEAAALRGRPAGEGLLPEDRRRTELALESVPAGGSAVELRSRLRRRDGTLAQLQWHALRLADDGSLLCLVRDVSASEAQRAELAQAQRALAQAGTELDALRRQAGASTRLRQDFMNHLGAGLRSSPVAIQSRADNLLQGLAGPLTPPQQRELTQLRETARSLAARVAALLDLALTESGELALAREPFDLLELVTQLAQELRDAVEATGQRWQAHVADDLGYARGDPQRVRQVLRELVGLALRAGGSTVALRAESPAAGMVRISVSDDGDTDEAARAAAFDPFRPGGSGLGPALALRLATLMGGTLTAGADTPGGSRYSVTLPADAVQGA